MTKRDITLIADVASITEVENWLRISADTRRQLMASRGLPVQSHLPWSELLAMVGLAPEQSKKLHKNLKRALWEPKNVAAHISKTPKTVAGWVAADSYPEGFPRPALIIGPRKKLWLPLDVEAYYRPTVYAKLAKDIRRLRARPRRPPRDLENPPVTLDPLDD